MVSSKTRRICKKLQAERHPDWANRQRVRSLFAESRPDPSCLRSAASLHEARVAIKREREESVERKALKACKAWSIELKSARSVVDLDAADDDIAPDDAASIEAALEEAGHGPDGGRGGNL